MEFLTSHWWVQGNCNMYYFRWLWWSSVCV